MSVLTRLLRPWFKQPHHPTKGYTLVELIVALVIALIIMNALLSFIVSLLNSERLDQAKATTQQSMQSALDFISNDVKSAVYIYDRTGLTAIRDKLPPQAGQANIPQCNSATTCEPVLAFWKRQFVDKCNVINNVRVGQVTGPSTAATITCVTGDPNSWAVNDAYVYSLVVYYLIRDNPASPNLNWSRSARIGRFEIRDGIPNYKPNSGDLTGYNTSPNITPDPGFQSFMLAPGDDKAAAMNRWKAPVSPAPSPNPYPNAGSAYPASSLQILTDYVDDTAFDNALLRYTISRTSALASPQNQADTDCSDPQKGSGGGVNAGVPQSQRIPGAFGSPTTSFPLSTSGFYVCVNSAQNVARVFLRGNASARLNQRQRSPLNTYQQPNLVQIDAQIAGRGGLQN